MSSPAHGQEMWVSLLSKGNRVIMQRPFFLETPNLTLTFDLKINYSLPLLMSNRCEISIVCQKVIELLWGNLLFFKLKIWPWPFDPKINRGPHHCLSKGKWVIIRKHIFPWMDRQTDMVKPVFFYLLAWDSNHIFNQLGSVDQHWSVLATFDHWSVK